MAKSLHWGISTESITAGLHYSESLYEIYQSISATLFSSRCCFNLAISLLWWFCFCGTTFRLLIVCSLINLQLKFTPTATEKLHPSSARNCQNHLFFKVWALNPSGFDLKLHSHKSFILSIHIFLNKSAFMGRWMLFFFFSKFVKCRSSSILYFECLLPIKGMRIQLVDHISIIVDQQIYLSPSRVTGWRFTIRSAKENVEFAKTWAHFLRFASTPIIRPFSHEWYLLNVCWDLLAPVREMACCCTAPML